MATQSEAIITGARQSNLKTISLQIPHDQVTVITGVSGSGKSSLAFDTIFAEGQWRYIESLSTYARMFLEKVDRPDVDRLENIRPAIAIEQKNQVRTSRSTVGTTTEIADLLRLLFAKIGRPLCPDCGIEAVASSPSEASRTLLREHEGARAMIMFPVTLPPGATVGGTIQELIRRGFVRVRTHETVIEIAGETAAPIEDLDDLSVVVDRLVLRSEDRSRLAEA